MLPDVFAELRAAVTREHVIISIAAGYTIEDLQNGLGENARVVRSMPNTPAMIGEGMTGVCYEDALFSTDEKAELDSFFSSFGKYERVKETLMDVVASASGRPMCTCLSRLSRMAV